MRCRGYSSLCSNVSLFVVRRGIAEIGLKTKMQYEAVEARCQTAFRSLENPCHGGDHVVETKPGQNTADMLKNPLRSFR